MLRPVTGAPSGSLSPRFLFSQAVLSGLALSQLGQGSFTGGKASEKSPMLMQTLCPHCAQTTASTTSVLPV